MKGLIRDLACGPALWGKLLSCKKAIEPQRVAQRNVGAPIRE